MTALVKQETLPLEPSSGTPADLLRIAMSKDNFPIETLHKLMEMQERWEAGQARKIYNRAFSEFKSEAVRLVKNVAVNDGPLKGKKYADLFGVVNALTEPLSKHGLTASWKLTKDEPTWLEVTCTLRHEAGHSESVSMGAAPDTGPGRNAIQARMSAVSYLERYTLLAVTGMAASGEDKDGVTPAEALKGVMPAEKVQEWVDGINSSPNLETLHKVWRQAMLAAGDDTRAKDKFIDAKNRRKEGLA